MTDGSAAPSAPAEHLRCVVADARPSALAWRVEEYADGAEHTVFPADAGDAEVVTTWLTAAADDVVDLEDTR